MEMRIKSSRKLVLQDIKLSTKPVSITTPKIEAEIKPKRRVFGLFNHSCLKRLLNKLPKLSKRTILLYGFIITAILIGITYYLLAIRPNQISKANDNNGDITTELIKGNPEYSTVLPSNKQVENLGGWTKISPPDADPVFAYVDIISNVGIIVSQQPLPKELKTDTDAKIEKLAQSFNAGQKITIKNSSVYIGVSKDGPQSVILTKKGLLILIKSTSSLSNNDWIEYINSLQ